MKISALIAEFNPFHAGHKYLIDSMQRKSDGIICVMSGNFVQRGECALYEKTDRATAAVYNGVDLVLELPTVYALSSAEGFARGAVEILHSCGVVDSLHFGSECGDIDTLDRCADILNNESDNFKSVLAKRLSEGQSFPAARQAALESELSAENIMSMPNNILAIEYIRALKKLGSNIVPMTIKREGAGYNNTDTDEKFPSASGIRSLIAHGENADKYMLYNYESTPTFMNRFDVMIASRLKAISKDELCLIPDCNGEIAARLKDASVCNTFEEILDSAACKRYTSSRIRRILCNMVIGNRFKEYISPTYIRPLAFNEKGSEILKQLKNTALLPVISRSAAAKDDAVFDLECKATDIYNLAHNIPGGKEFSHVARILF